MKRCWIHSLVYRADCDLCIGWSQLQMVVHGQVFLRRSALGLMPMEGVSVTYGSDPDADLRLFERRNGMLRVEIRP